MLPAANQSQSASILPSGRLPSRVTSFQLRSPCGNSTSLLRLRNLRSPVELKLPRPDPPRNASRRAGPVIKCTRGVVATYDVTCGQGNARSTVQVRLWIQDRVGRTVPRLFLIWTCRFVWAICLSPGILRWPERLRRLRTVSFGGQRLCVLERVDKSMELGGLCPCAL
jgi:hypothetical protein